MAEQTIDIDGDRVNLVIASPKSETPGIRSTVSNFVLDATIQGSESGFYINTLICATPNKKIFVYYRHKELPDEIDKILERNISYIAMDSATYKIFLKTFGVDECPEKLLRVSLLLNEQECIQCGLSDEPIISDAAKKSQLLHAELYSRAYLASKLLLRKKQQQGREEQQKWDENKEQKKKQAEGIYSLPVRKHENTIEISEVSDFPTRAEIAEFGLRRGIAVKDEYSLSTFVIELEKYGIKATCRLYKGEECWIVVDCNDFEAAAKACPNARIIQ